VFFMRRSTLRERELWR